MDDEKRGKGAPFVKGSETSADAADSIIERKTHLKSIVFTLIDAAGARGLTDQEIQLSLSMDPNTQRPRRVELEKEGRVVKKYIEGKQVKRINLSGRKANVYINPLYATEMPPTEQIPAPARGVPDEFIPSENKELADLCNKLSFLCDMSEKELLGIGGTLPDYQGIQELESSIFEGAARLITALTSERDRLRDIEGGDYRGV
jgi:hypothetical protein